MGRLRAHMVGAPDTEPTMTDWTLHPQLARDTIPVADLKLCQVLIINDANYPWVLLVPRRPEIVDIIDLADPDRQLLMSEIARVSEALRKITRCDKLNVAALGNVVPQLHVHVIARFRNDPAWPKPVWGALPPKTYDQASLDALAGRLKQALLFGF
jgi:diadenosine tetraphosphate (Ap4A) HIT family hydrolase